MAERIELPPVLQGTAEEQTQQLRSYLYRVATALNVNMDTAGSETVTLTDEERILMNNIANANKSSAEPYIGANFAEAETLKSLIIKTATFVKNVQDNYNLILFGDENAQSQYGNWNRKKGLRVDVTPDGIKQTYSYAEVISGLKQFEINAKNYIKTGYLHDDEHDLPVYGVAIGKDVVTFSEDGKETYVDGNKVAELTADELSFYQNEQKVASYKGTQMTYFLSGKARLIIDGSGMTIQDANENKLAELKGTALSFYQNNVKLAEFSTDSQDQLIQFFENIELPSEINNEKHIKLQSGNSIVLIDPTQINMNTDGLVSIKGNSNSIIRLIGNESEDKIFQADADGGVLAKTIKSSEAVVTDMEVTNLTVTGNLAAAIPIPNIVISSTQPASGSNTIWLEPNNGVVTPYSYTQSVNNASTSSWSTVTANIKWTQTCNLSTSIQAEGAKKLKISGKLYKNGSTAAWGATLTAVVNVSNGNVSTIDLGTVGTFPYMQSLNWDYGFSKEITISTAITSGEIVSVTYTWTISGTTDAFAALSYPHAVTLNCSGETGSGSSDECTVHYIP